MRVIFMLLMNYNFFVCIIWAFDCLWFFITSIYVTIQTLLKSIGVSVKVIIYSISHRGCYLFFNIRNICKPCYFAWKLYNRCLCSTRPYYNLHSTYGHVHPEVYTYTRVFWVKACQAGVYGCARDDKYVDYRGRRCAHSPGPVIKTDETMMHV